MRIKGSVPGLVPKFLVDIVRSTKSQEPNHVNPQVVQEPENDGSADDEGNQVVVLSWIGHNDLLSEDGRESTAWKQWTLWRLMVGAG